MGDWPGGLADLDAALQIDPTCFEALMQRGIAFATACEFDQARHDFSDAIRAEPENPWPHVWRGSIFVRLENFDAALDAFSRAIQLDPGYAIAFFNRGAEFERRGDHAAAFADYSESIRLDHSDPDFHAARARVGTRLGRYDQAIADATAALALRPDDSYVLELRGAGHFNSGDYESAIADYTDAIRLEPDRPDLFAHRGRAHYYLADLDEALADFDWALRLDSACVDAIVGRGRVFASEDEPEQAIAEFTAALRFDPQCVDAWVGRGREWFDTDEFEKAVTDLTEAIRLDPARKAAYEWRARAWECLDEPARADSDFDMAENLESKAEQTMPERKPPIFQLLQAHFEPAPLDQLTITERRFPERVRADVQRAIDSLLDTVRVLHFCGIRKQFNHAGVNFNELIVRDRRDPPLSVPPQYEEIDIGEELPLRCLKEGLWLLEDAGARFAVFLEPPVTHRRSATLRFQVATVNDECGLGLAQKFFGHLERSVQEARSYRGKILSLEQGDGYSGESTGIRVHKLRTVDRDQVILPRQTLDLLDRNVIQFVQQRPRLAELGLATKKGLLFYGPPGTGKTHTIHYLAGALPGTTTLLITAEQVGLIGEYMTLARLLQPSMVVIEDADLIARERSSMNSPCEEVLLNKLLNEMDGLRAAADILFVLTTNRPEALESALSSRPGRIDQAIEFPFPDDEGRTKLVRLYACEARVAEAVVANTVARTAGVSAAFIKELMRRAAQFQLEREGAEEITQADIENALEELLFRGGSLNRKLLGGQIQGG